ncbi:MAG: hypothetical protein ACI857_002315 [Arenicella sp.]|jgi:hypothetical protein
MPVDESKLERAVAVTIPQKIKQLILGKVRPNLLTRVSVGSVFVVWVYLFSWHLMTFLSLIMMNGLKPGWRNDVIPAFHRVGSKLYGYADTVNMLNVHSILQFAIFFIMLLGLILVWRKKRIGFLFYIVGAIGSLAITFFVLGYEFLITETTIVDWTLLIGSALYFTFGAWWFYKWKERKNKQEAPQAQKTAG